MTNISKEMGTVVSESNTNSMGNNNDIFIFAVKDSNGQFVDSTSIFRNKKREYEYASSKTIVNGFPYYKEETDAEAVKTQLHNINLLAKFNIDFHVEKLNYLTICETENSLMNS